MVSCEWYDLVLAGGLVVIMIHICFSVFMTWVLWLAAAAAVTQSVGGNLHCRCVRTYSLTALLPDTHAFRTAHKLNSFTAVI